MNMISIGDAAKKAIDRWAYWRAALKGEFGDLTIGVPECGYYRHQGRDGRYVPIGIWFDDASSAIVATVDGRAVRPDAEWAERVFAYACRNPITYDTFKAVSAGEPWPDAAPVTKAPSNLPDDPFEAIKIDLAGEAELVADLLKAGIADDSAGGRAASLADRIARTGKRADGLRTDEKRPHDDASKAVQAKWKPVVDQAADLVSRLKSAIGAHLMAKQRAAAEEERKRRAAEEEARRLADEEAKAKGEPAPPPPPPVLERPKPVPTKIAGAEGRTIALRKIKQAKIVDYDAALAALKDHAEVREVVESLCNRTIRNGLSLPGVEVEIVEKAA